MASGRGRTSIFTVAVVPVTVAALVAAAAAGGQSPTLERYTATVVNEPGRGTSTVQIVVDRWSTDTERDTLVQTLLDRGPESLLETLQDMPAVGYLRSPTSTRWDLRFARSSPLPDGGERVVVATDRPLTFWERANQPRTVDYPFTIVELRLNAQGEGEGKLSLATKIVADRQSGTIVLEDYAIQPTLLQAVKREKGA